MKINNSPNGLISYPNAPDPTEWNQTDGDDNLMTKDEFVAMRTKQYTDQKYVFQSYQIDDFEKTTNSFVS